MNGLMISLATLSVACATPSGWLRHGIGLGHEVALAGPVPHGAVLAGPAAHGASVVGPSTHGTTLVGPAAGAATVVGPSTHGVAVVGPSVGHSAVIGASTHGAAIVGPAVGLRGVGLGLGTVRGWGQGVSVVGPHTVPVTIAGPAGAIHAKGLWGPTLAHGHGGHWQPSFKNAFW